MARGGREFFVTGHSEYSPYTLDGEYRRDLAKGLPIDMPKNYYRNDDRTGTAGTLEKHGQPAVLQLAELLCISGNSLRY